MLLGSWFILAGIIALSLESFGAAILLCLAGVYLLA